MGRLVIYRDSERLAEHDLSRGVIGLGRHPENDIVLDDRTLSRFHAKIMRQGGGDGARWVVVDLGAQNGVHLNGERISDEVELHSGDRIELGRYTAVFEQPVVAPGRNGSGRPAAAKAPPPAPPPAAAKAPAPPSSSSKPAASARPAPAQAPLPKPAARPSAVDDLDLDLDEDLSIGDDLDVDLDLDDDVGTGGERPAGRADDLGDDLDGDLADELDDDLGLGDVSDLDAPTNTSGKGRFDDLDVGVTNARDDGMTANLSSVLDDELDDDSNEVSHAAFVAPKPTFVLLFNGLEVSRHPLGGTELTIGRSKQCDIVISLLGLSRKHAQMTMHDEGVVVEDLGSQNGTWVNNQRIAGRQVLKHGDLLNFYDYGVLFLEDGDVDVGLPGAAFSATATTGSAAIGRDDLSARETDRALPPPPAKAPAAPAKAPAAPAKVPAAPAKAAPPPALTAKPAVRPAVAEPAAADDDDDLGLGERASSLGEETEFGRQRPGSKRAGDDRFELDELGDGSFLGDEFEDGASKDRAAGAKAGNRHDTGVVPAIDLSRAGDDEDLEASIAFDNAAKLGDNDEFGDMNTDGEVHGLADRTSAGIDVASLHGSLQGGTPGAWPSDDDLDRALAQTNDTAAVTIDVTMKGKSYAQIPLSQAVTRVGTDPRCECALPKASGLRSWHMTFAQMGGAVVVTRANRSAKLEVGGKEIDAATLRNGDIIRIGAVEMKLRFRR